MNSPRRQRPFKESRHEERTPWSRAGRRKPEHPKRCTPPAAKRVKPAEKNPQTVEVQRLAGLALCVDEQDVRFL